MWACGVIMYLLLTGENPFDSDDKNMSDDDNEQKFFINR
jgi:serine/threonine protein kinase